MQRKLAVVHVVSLGMCGVRRASRALGVARSTCYRDVQVSPQRAHSEALLVCLSRQHPTLGARKVAAMVELEHGEVVNHKRAARLRRVHGLHASRRGRKRRRLERGVSQRQVAEQRDEVWSYDFIHDATADGRGVRVLSIVDECSRECLLLEASRSFPAQRVIDALEKVLMTTGRCPQYLRSDNGPEFISKAVKEWLQQAGVQSAYIEPGAPWEPERSGDSQPKAARRASGVRQNGYVESFHASLRSELLDRELFFDLGEVQAMAEDWRGFYNHRRPHGSLNYVPPVRHQQQASLRAFATLQLSAAHAARQAQRSPLKQKQSTTD